MEHKQHNMNKQRQRIKYIVADILSSLLVWLCFLMFRWMVNDGRVFGYETVLVPAFNFYIPLFVYPLACFVVHYLSGYYVRPYRKTMAQEFLTTLTASLIISVGAFFAIILDDQVPSYQRYYVSLLALFILQFVISYVFRLGITLNTRKLVRKGIIRQNTVLVGTGQNARRIAAELGKAKDGTQVIGFIAIDNTSKEQTTDVLGNLDNFAELKNEYQIDSTVIALDNDVPENRLFQIINLLYPYGVEIQFTPRIYEILTGAARIHNLDISPLVNITKASMADWEASVKRAMDIVLSIIALIITSPLLCFCAIGIKRSSPGPVFYKQERIGLYGKPFDIIKLRTMYVGSEQEQPMLSNPNDKRVTPFGRWLRKYRIDELPQFVNVLLGEMSLVGPRPERRYYIEQIVKEAPYYCLIYKIRPGLTSWGPIKIGYSDTVEKMIERLNYDIIYMDNMSLKTDLKILLYTIEVIIKGKGQ